MKKFYYKKEVSIDKTPIILRLERRHTMDAKKDDVQEEQNSIATRSTSTSTVDQLKDETTVPRTKTREVAKSLSEDVLSKGRSKYPPAVITEAELSSSLLYNTRKASINSKDSPNQPYSQQADDLSPVALKDPKMKPVPVRSSILSPRTSSCFCYFAIMMAISFCTIGFIATIAGILYMEVFTSKNLASHQSSEAMIDLANLVQESVSLDDNESMTRDFQIEANDETIIKSFEYTDETNNKSRNGVSNGNQTNTTHNVDTGKSEETELSQFLDSRNAEIKFQDGDTIIYEIKSSSSLDYEKNSTVLDDLKFRNLDSHLNETKNSSKDNQNRTDEVIEEKRDEKLENLETFLNSQSDKVKDLLTTDSKEDLELQSSDRDNLEDLELQPSDNLEDLELQPSDRDNMKEQSFRNKSDVELKSENISVTFANHNESEISNSVKPESSGPDLETNDIFHFEDIPGSIISMRKDNDEAKLKSSDLNESLKEVELESQTGQKVESSLFVSADQEKQQNKSEHDVESMIMVINEPADDSSSDFVPNRKGDINFSSETSNSEPSFNSSQTGIKIAGGDPVARVTMEPHRFRQQMSQEPLSPNKQLDMKVSLAEAMKNLQVLDVNNKILTSRIKSAEPKAPNAKKTKESDTPKKGNITLEKMRYLQKVRLLLYENLQ